MKKNEIPLSELDEKIQELINISKTTNAPVHIIHQDNLEGLLLSNEVYQAIISDLDTFTKQIPPSEAVSTKKHSFFSLVEFADLAKKQFSELEEAYIQLLLLSALALEPHQSYAYGHNERVALFSCETARQLGCSEAEVYDLHLASILHDIGEIVIPIHILQKEEELSEEEWSTIRDHPRTGAELVRKVKKMENVADIIYAHQEKFNGSGYPEGLKGNEIPLGARILSIADTYDAMTNLRLHRDPFNHYDAVNELKKFSGVYYDPQIVEIFINLF